MFQAIIISASVLFGAYFHKAVLTVASIVGSGAYNVACDLISLCR
jgi:hypothetical protein